MIISPLLHRLRATVLILLFGLLTVFALSARAQSPGLPTFDRMTLNHLDRIIAGTPGISSVGIANGVNVAASGSVNVTASNGVRIPIPTTATATISKAAMAAAAVKAVRAANILGAAYTAYEVYNWVKDSGISTCAPPDFFCKPAGSSTPTYLWRTGSSALLATPQAACTSVNGSFNGERCVYAGQYMIVYWQGSCTSPYTVQGYSGSLPQTPNQTCVLPAGTPAPVAGPYTDAELNDAILSANWDTARSQKMYDALRNDLPKMPGSYTNADIVPGMSTVNVVASPVTTPRTTVKTDTVVTGDGKTLEVKTEEQIKIIPNLSLMNRVDSPSSLAQFKEEMTRYTGETDLATGVYKQTSQAVSTPTATATPTTDATGPTECGSPGKPKCAIDETGTPTTQAATDAMTAPNAELEKAKTDFTTRLTDVVSSDGKDTSLGWFPALPVGSCTPFVLSPKLPAVDWCPVIPRIKDMMQWMWAMFTIFACIHMVNNTMKGN